MQDEDLKLDDQVLQPDAESGAMHMQAPSADPQSISDGIMSEIIQEQAQEATEFVAPVIIAKALDAEPVPDISTLTAARDAAAFVAQIFADPSISDAADAEVTEVESQPEAEPQEVVELPPVPVHWPQGAAQHLQGQRVLILGLGISGIAMARWCVRAGAEVTVADTREALPICPRCRPSCPACALSQASSRRLWSTARA